MTKPRELSVVTIDTEDKPGLHMIALYIMCGLMQRGEE